MENGNKGDRVVSFMSKLSVLSQTFTGPDCSKSYNKN